jgi:catechol 2,3-dioxygenase-like lactoylglutathione lyase family enzyme
MGGQYEIASRMGTLCGGGCGGIAGIQSLVAQQNKNTSLRINHVGIRAKDYQQSLEFYTKLLGLKVAYKFPGPEVVPTTTVLQVNKDTFVELMPPASNRPTGFTHFGIYTDDVAATVARLRQAGATVDDARASNTGAKMTFVTDPDGVRIEILELLPDSPLRKAIEGTR